MTFEEKNKIMTQKFTDENFEALVLNSSQPIVIDFMAEWCPPCKMIGLAIDSISDDYNEQSRFGVKNMPTVLFLKDGKVIDKHVGATTKKVLEEKLKAIL